MKNIEIRASPDAECIWHKIVMRDYRIRNKLEDGVPTFPKNHPCVMDCNGYDFDCKNYDSLSRERFLHYVKKKFGEDIKVNKLEFFK